AVEQHLSRARLGAPQGDWRAQLHQLRLAPDRRQVRRPHRAVHRGEEFLGRIRARGDHFEDLRADAVLLHAARPLRGGGGGARRQRLRQGRAVAAADGVRRRGAEADRDLPRRQRRLIPRMSESKMSLLEVKNLDVEVDGKKILEGFNLTVNAGEVHAIMGPNGSGKSTLSYVLAGKDDYEVTAGSIRYGGEDLLSLEPDERAAKGLFLAFQYPLEIPGVSTMVFLRTAAN